MTGVRRIDQVVPTLAGRDAIGRHTLQVRKLLRQMGFASEVYFANASTDVLDEGRHIEQFGDADPDGRWLLYQMSIGSPVASTFAGRPEPKLVDYHNISPAELFDPWEPEVSEELKLGRLQMRQLAPLTTLAMADSPYNEAELKSAGYALTAVAPLLIDLDTSRVEPTLGCRGGWRHSGPRGATTFCSWARWPLTRPSTICSRPLPSTGGCTTLVRGCDWWEGR